MSDQRAKRLSSLLKIMVAVGLFAAAIPFIGSLRPSKLSDELDYSERLSLADISPNSANLVFGRPSREWRTGTTIHHRPGRAWLITRDNHRNFRVFALPTWEGSIVMGRSYWGQFDGFCDDFGLSAEGTDFDEAEIRCRDENEQFFSKYWRWTLDGENISGEFVDLELVRSEVRRNELVVFDYLWNLE